MKNNKAVVRFLILLLVVIFCSYNFFVFDEKIIILRFFALFPFLLLVLRYIKDYEVKVDLINPDILIALSVFIGTTLRTIWLTAKTDSAILDEKRRDILLGQSLDDLFFPLFLINIGVISYLIGKNIKFKLRFFNYSPTNRFFYFKKQRLGILLLFGGIVSLIGLYFLLKNVGVNEIIISNLSDKRRTFDETGQRISFAWIRTFGKFSKYCFYLTILYFYIYKPIRKRSISIAILGVFSLVISVIYGIVTSSRTSLLELIIVMIIIIVISGKSIPKKTIIIVITTFVFLAASIESVRKYKIGKVSNREIHPLESLTANNNLFGISKTGKITRHVLETDYYYGSTYIGWIFAPIPRQIWKDKPPINPGMIVRLDILGSDSANNVGGGMPPGIIAESFMNFGFFGLIFISMIWGGFTSSIHKKIKYLYVRDQIHGLEPIKIIIIAVIFMEFSYRLSGGSFTQSIVNSLEAILILRLFKLFKIYANWKKVF